MKEITTDASNDEIGSYLHGKGQRIGLVTERCKQVRRTIVVLPAVAHKEAVASRAAEPLEPRRGVAVESVANVASARKVETSAQEATSAKRMFDAKCEVNVNLRFRHGAQSRSSGFAQIVGRQGQRQASVSFKPIAESMLIKANPFARNSNHYTNSGCWHRRRLAGSGGADGVGGNKSRLPPGTLGPLDAHPSS